MDSKLSTPLWLFAAAGGGALVSLVLAACLAGQDPFGPQLALQRLAIL